MEGAPTTRLSTAYWRAPWPVSTCDRALHLAARGIRRRNPRCSTAGTRTATTLPGCTLLLTQMTPTGRDTARELFGNSCVCVYLPYDLAWPVARFLRHFRPAFGVLMETEIWPNLVHQRVSCSGCRCIWSMRGCQSVRHAVMAKLRRLAARHSPACRPSPHKQTPMRNAWRRWAPRISVCGNIKFDVQPPAQRQNRTAAIAMR